MCLNSFRFWRPTFPKNPNKIGLPTPLHVAMPVSILLERYITQTLNAVD